MAYWPNWYCLVLLGSVCENYPILTKYGFSMWMNNPPKTLHIRRDTRNIQFCVWPEVLLYECPSYQGEVIFKLWLSLTRLWWEHPIRNTSLTSTAWLVLCNVLVLHRVKLLDKNVHKCSWNLNNAENLHEVRSMLKAC